MVERMSTRNLSPTIKAGALFPKIAHSSFIELTGRQYSNMVARMKRKGLPPPPFSLEEFRTDVLGVMGGQEDGPIICRYCHGVFTLAEIAVDHAKPLSQGGSASLENLDYPCAADNDGKGGLDVQQYLDLLAFLEKDPIMRRDVLSRLKRSNALAASARRAQILGAKLKQIEGGKAPKAKAESSDDMPEF
jgi:hypothetical protein